MAEPTISTPVPAGAAFVTYKALLCGQVQLRFQPAAMSAGADFVDGAVTIAANGSPEAQELLAPRLVALKPFKGRLHRQHLCDDQLHAGTPLACDVLFTRSSKGRFLRVADGDLLILPQEMNLSARPSLREEGTLNVRTELGDLQVPTGDVNSFR